MVTLKQLFQQFGHDKNWKRFVMASTQPMVCVFLRKLGNHNISSLSDFDLTLQLSISEQPQERKVKAESCMRHMLSWAAEHGYTDIPSMEAQSEHSDTVDDKCSVVTEPVRVEKSDKNREIHVSTVVDHHQKRSTRASSAAKLKQTGDDDSECAATRSVRVKPVPKTKNSRKSDKKDIKTRKVNVSKEKHTPKLSTSPVVFETVKEPVELDRPGKTGSKCHGTVYHDTGSKGDVRAGKRRIKDCWRAEITIDGQRYRHRSKDPLDCKKWLEAIRSGDIHPTDNKADWYRMEQREDEKARFDELIVSAAEEANIVYEYHQNGDLQILFDYCVKSLLPHMVYYCTHTLHLSRKRTFTLALQAVGLILTKITAGRPVSNLTSYCKRMLRIYSRRGDFWYYEKVPEKVRLMVNRIDISELAELYKVTKDRRL